MSPPRALPLPALVLVSCLPAGSSPAAPDPALSPRAGVAAEKAGERIPGELLVRFRPGASALERAAATASVGGRVLAGHGANEKGGARTDRSLARVAVSQDLDRALARLSAQPAVAYAEPNLVLRRAFEAADPLYAEGRLWGLQSEDRPAPVGPAGTTNEFGSRAEVAWAAGSVGSREVVVAVLDTGTELEHPDLAANLWTNPHDPPNGLDDDGNGFIDDTRGWDFRADDASVYDGPEDDHGTHCAGTIGAVGGDGRGLVGVAWEVTLLPLKFLGPEGGSSFDAIRALDYLVDLKERHGTPVVAVNCSWGSPGYSRALHEATIRAARAGILVVAAAGNAGADSDETPYYPAGHDTRDGTLFEDGTLEDGVISVAAIDSLGGLASFSNRGAGSVDLGAPGVAILSALPGGGYGRWNGTSMAAPHVSGALALLAAARPGAPAGELRQALFDAARPTESLAGTTLTGGRLDVGAALADEGAAAPALRRDHFDDALRRAFPLPLHGPVDESAGSWSEPRGEHRSGRLTCYRLDFETDLRLALRPTEVELRW